MGVLNVTPDSFSDGGEFLDREQRSRMRERMLDEGADIIDVGGESTRPGATSRCRLARTNLRKIEERRSPASARVAAPTVSAEDELKRVIPVIAELKKKRPSAVISVDTYKAAVARAAVGAGAEIVNDVSGFRWDPLMTKTLVELKCGSVLMHMRGRPEEWRTLPPPGDVVAAGEAGTERVGGESDPGGRAARTHRARSRLRIREEL